MKSLLVSIVVAVLLVGCGESRPHRPEWESQHSTTPPESKSTEPIAEATQPEPPTAKAPDISIHDAAEKGNIEASKQHLADGVDVNAKKKGGGTPLHAAATKEIAELLIAEGAGVNVKNRIGRTPLHNADNKEIAELLIAKGANVNAMLLSGPDQGQTPLDTADDKEIADLLRKHGGQDG